MNKVRAPPGKRGGLGPFCVSAYNENLRQTEKLTHPPNPHRPKETVLDMRNTASTVSLGRCGLGEGLTCCAFSLPFGEFTDSNGFCAY